MMQTERLNRQVTVSIHYYMGVYSTSLIAGETRFSLIFMPDIFFIP